MSAPLSSGLTAEETEFADLVERCNLPELTRREICERFICQSLRVHELQVALDRARGIPTKSTFHKLRLVSPEVCL